MLIGIVGKPSAGKSTFLNAACLTNAKVANYPFTTIEPNLGTSSVKVKCVCKSLGVNDNPKNSTCINGIRFIPIKLLDVAGLVPDAHLGKGMGNKFLSDLARADALIHVIDISGGLDAEGQEIEEGARDPLEDIKFLEDEINFWFKDIIIRTDWAKFVRTIRQEKLSFIEMLYERLAGLSIKKEHIHSAIKKSQLDINKIVEWNEKEILHFATSLREISKPILIAANKIDRKKGNDIFERVKATIKTPIIPCSALAEFWLRKFDEKGIIRYIPGDSTFEILKKDQISQQDVMNLENLQNKILNKYKSTGIQTILNEMVFNILKQIVVYPVYDVQKYSDKDGNVLPDAHLVTKGTLLKDFVEEKVHSELAKNFIYGLNAKNKMRLGDAYILENDDVVKIVSAAK